MRITDNPKHPNGRVIFPILCPTRHSGPPATTMYSLVSAVFEMGFWPLYVQQSRYGFAFTRTCCFIRLKSIIDVNRVRGLFIDDDMLLEDKKGFGAAVTRAEEHGWSFVAPYRQSYSLGEGLTVEVVDVCFDGSGRETGLSDAHNLKPWQRVTTAGLGFFYGDLPLDYTFKEGDPNKSPGIGEDYNFFHDNPDIEVRLAPLRVGHIKPKSLELDASLELFANGEERP